MNSLTLKDIFNRPSIINRAKDEWDFKDEREKVKCSHKYKHIFTKYKYETHDWRNLFDNLSSKQQLILIKGELIRTYDSLSNSDKTEIKKELDLSVFCTKWYKLPSEDKSKLLHYIL